MKELLNWDIYEITTEKTPINGVMLRWRIRKFWLEKWQNILTENTQDIDASVRFSIIEWEDVEGITTYLKSIISDINIELVLQGVRNPVLSKLKINREERYTL